MIQFGYGEDRYEDRRELRDAVWEIAGARCEHPLLNGRLEPGRCPNPATELAHIVPRGMGHTGYRDTVNNAIAACEIHARSTDDMSSAEWVHVPEPGDRLALADWILTERRRAGWAV